MPFLNWNKTLLCIGFLQEVALVGLESSLHVLNEVCSIETNPWPLGNLCGHIGPWITLDMWRLPCGLHEHKRNFDAGLDLMLQGGFSSSILTINFLSKHKIIVILYLAPAVFSLFIFSFIKTPKHLQKRHSGYITVRIDKVHLWLI